jgi:hypothetical protein
MEVTKSYEEQKQELFDIAEEKFGRDYFEQLELLTKEYTEEEMSKYSLTVNYKGAFYAIEE